MLKKTGIILGLLIVTLYVLFLIVPFFLTGFVNSYNDEIAKLVENSFGLKLKLENISIVTTPKLTAGIQADNISLMYPDDEEFFSTENAEVKISLLPLLIRRIEVDVVKADRIRADLKVRPDGKFLIEEYIPQSNTEESEISAPITGLPLGLKLSNHLPDIRVKLYDLSLIDMRNNKKYSISGDSLKLTDFILNKKIKVSTNGSITLDDTVPFNYDIKIFNKIMPNIDLNDLLFAQNNSEEVKAEPIAFNIIDIIEGIKKNQLEANIITDIKTYGNMKNIHIDGLIDIENLTIAVNDKKLPEGHVKLSFHGKKVVSDIALYTAENEITTVSGEMKGSSKVDFVVKSNAQINNIFNVFKSIASSFNYNDLDTLTASGGIDADFNIKSDMKTITSSGYFKIPSASVKYSLYNLLIDKINADIDFANDTVNLKNFGFTILSHPLRAYGTIKNDSTADLHLTADKLLIKGLLAAAGQVAILRDNDFKSGTVSMDASISGKLKNIQPVVDIVIDNVNVLNKPSSTSIKVADSKINILSDGKTYKGNIGVHSISVANPALSLAVPQVNILLDEKDINIDDTYLLLDNSKIDISGKISDYTTKKLAINLKAEGSLLADDLRNMIPADIRSMFSAKGAMPLSVKISGNDKQQIVDAQILATPSGYLHVFDISGISGKSSLIRSNIAIENNSLKFTDTGLYATTKTNILDVNDKTQLVRITGSVDNLSNPQFNGLKLETLSTQTISIPGFANSKASVNGNIILDGFLMNPSIKGIVSVLNVSLPSIKTTLKNITADLGGNDIDITLPLITIDNSSMSADAVVSSNFLKGIIMKSVNFKGDLIDADTLGAAFSGMSPSNSPSSASTAVSSSSPQNLGIVIQNGKGSVTKFKTGKITATNLTSDFGLKNNVFYLKNLKGNAFSGTINGNITCNIISGLATVNMTGSDMNAVNAIAASAGIPNALSGILDFDAKLKLNAFAADFNAMMKSITGNVSFNVKDGHYANIGTLDSLLLAQNIAANAILKAALAPIRNMPIVQNASNFKSITGMLTLKNGVANLSSVKSTGPSLAYFVTGQYNLISGYTNVIILGRLGADIVAVLGPLGELSATKLTSYIPKFGAQTAKILNALTSNPETENTSQIPALSTGNTNTKDFKVVFTGNVTSASSIKSFKWLSNCDTSAITGGSLKEQLKTSTDSLKETGKNNVEDVKKSVESVKEAAKNTADNIKEQVQKTKDSFNELKNLFKKKDSEPAVQ